MDFLTIISFPLTILLLILQQNGGETAVADDDLKSTRIVGGRYALKNEIPYIVAILEGTDRTSFCGGSIYNKKFIITAAHCFPPEDRAQQLKIVKVLAGALSLRQKGGDSQLIGVKRIITHEQYDDEDDFNDIALLELEKPLKFNDAVQPIALPSPGTPPPSGGMATVSGWGETKMKKDDAPDGPASVQLKTVDLKIVSRRECLRYHSKIPIKEVLRSEAKSRKKGVEPPTTSHICAGLLPDGGEDACQGDSGGPLTCARKIGNRKLEKYLCGVVSGGWGCGLKLPGAYTDVAKFRGWIVKNAKET